MKKSAKIALGVTVGVLAITGISVAAVFIDKAIKDKAHYQQSLDYLWDSVEEYVQSKNIVVSKNNDLDTYHNEEQNILNNVIKTFEVNSNLSFKDCVESISREFDTIKIKIDDAKFEQLNNVGLFNLNSIKFTDKDIIIDSVSKTISLSGLGFQSPKEYFVQENGKYILNKEILNSCQELEIFLPKFITPENVDNTIFKIDAEHVNRIENISLHDDFIFTVPEFFYRNHEESLLKWKLTNVKLPRKLTFLPNLTFTHSLVKNVHMYSNLTKIGNYCFRNTRIGPDIILPKSINEIGKWAFSSYILPGNINQGQESLIDSQLKTITTSAKILDHEVFAYQKKLERINFLFDDIDVSKWTQNPLANLPTITKIYVKSENIKNAITQKYNDLTNEIIVNPNLEQELNSNK